MINTSNIGAYEHIVAMGKVSSQNSQEFLIKSKTLILTDESKGCDSPHGQHNLQSSKDPMRWIRYFEIYETFGHERSIVLDNKTLLEQLVNTIDFQSLRKT